MKQTLFFLLLPIIISAQNTNGFFDISKDAFYYEKMNEWKKTVYKDFDCKFTTVIDNDSIFSFNAQNYFFKEHYQLSLDKQKRIKKIEIFFTVHKGKLEDWFPYKYPINIASLFKDIGNPSLTEQNISYMPILNINASEYNFKKYYKQDNVSFLKTNIKLEVANGTTKVPIRNKKGKIKEHIIIDFGYISYTPKSKGSITENDINFNTATKIAEGSRKMWHKNQHELINLLGLERFNTSNSWIDGELYPYLFYLENTNDPKEYFKAFYSQATIIYDIKFGSVISESNQKYTYTSLPDGVLARAIGMDKECCIEILIDLENWNKSNYIDKFFIMYHELGHDIFGLEHSDGIRLMTTNKLDIDDPSILGEMIHEMFMAILKNQKRK